MCFNFNKYLGISQVAFSYTGIYNEGRGYLKVIEGYSSY